MGIKKILVANRGEIALRVMKTAKRLGIKTVAVFSEADRNAPHVLFADEAVLLGPAPSKSSYLSMEKILSAIESTNADAVHPGYGFLSENAVFANLLEQNGITFIGPSAYSIEIMGDKLSSKEAVSKYDVPMVPGSPEAITDINKAKALAKEIGYPVLIKASAGGGGKGMRIVKSASEIESQMERAVSEAISAFGNGAVFVEKYISSPRHIEIQILADNHGNIIHLFERECSIQRRHQKVVEEAPSSILTPELRSKMGDAAINVARSCKYSGAGTVEFLLDENHKFYFLEMNTRLQVEHPVTEMITGIDLVEQQIRVAENNVLTINQEDLNINGSSIELRIYAEDPANNFLPSIGVLEIYRPPNDPHVRVDGGFVEGMEIPIHYDPMLAKLVVHGASRNDAIEKMKEAIRSFELAGVATTLDFGEFVMNHSNFVDGDFDTHFIEKYFSQPASLNGSKAEEKVASTFATWLFKKNKEKLKLPANNNSEWEKRKYTEL